MQIQPLNTFLQPDFVVRNTADNTAGTIRYAATQAFPNLPVDGSGPVARITFQGLQPGTFTMTWGTVELADVNGGLIQATTQPCVITFTSSTAVTLARFEATPQLDHVLVAWETISETDNAGFNLYRAESASGPQTLLAYVPAQAPGSTQGFAYTYDDLPVQPGQTYWYWLEAVSLNGATDDAWPGQRDNQRAGGGHAGLAAGHTVRVGVLPALAGIWHWRRWPVRREYTAGVRLRTHVRVSVYSA